MSEDALTTCPSCNAEELERLIANTSFSLKGGGWYADGYGPRGKKKPESPPKAEPSKNDTTKPAKPAKPAKPSDSGGKSGSD